MKTTVPLFKNVASAILVCVFVASSQFSQAQSGASQQATGLVFRNPVLDSGVALRKNAVYLFKDVFQGVDARLKIENLVNGAEVTKIDDNSGGLGYTNALQPEVKTPGGLRESYAEFSIRFFQEDTKIPTVINKVQATALDIDGNLTLKEFCEIDMNGGTASFMSTTLDINIIQLLLSKFKATNILGIERSGIDTSALGNMYTVAQQNISSFTFRYGSNTIAGGSTSRQFSLYMKGFNYPNLATLPVKLVSFSAVLNTTKVDLKWTTAEEKNVSHFEIEKSLDGKNYTSTGVVFAYGNTAETMHYTFSDNSVNTSKTAVIYYRLRSVDIDQKSQLSEVRVIRTGKSNEHAISILTYPNPVSNELRVTIPTSWQGKKVSFEIIGNNGQSLLTKQTASGSQTENLNLSQLATGYYLVRVTCNGESAQQKIIKQ